MNLEGGRRQTSRQLELPWESRGEAPRVPRSDEPPAAVQGTERPGAGDLVEKVLERRNMQVALRRVRKNRGRPGVDGMTVAEILPYLWEHWEEIKSSLLDGSYHPRPVRRQEIPKSAGGIRELGIPTVLDRLIQQALLQVLQPIFDPSFSEHSHGFRPGRSAHGAIREAQRYVQGGRRIVVDVDLERFFDHVNHDVLMGKLRINESKSAVAPATTRDFLGYAFWDGPGKRVRLRVSKKALGKMKGRVRQITGRQGGRSLPQVVGELRSYLMGWRNYFGLASTPRIFADLDQWIRRRLRALQLKQWKRGRTIFRELRARGASVDVAAQVAANARRWWRNACLRVHHVLRNSHFDELGLPGLAK